MTENITGIAKYEKYLVLLLEKRIVVAHNNGNAPNEWPQQHFSDVGTNNDFVRELAIDFVEILNGTAICGPEREEAEAAIMALLVEGLLPTFIHLRDIRISGGKVNVIKQRQLVEDFTSALWRSYKTLFPKIVTLLGFDVGFLFRPPNEFDNGAATFISAHPKFAGVVEFMSIQRATWQLGLKDFRNEFVEHRNAPREGFEKYYNPENAYTLFEYVWKAMEEMLLTFLASRSKFFTIERISKGQQDSIHPRCFRWVRRSS